MNRKPKIIYIFIICIVLMTGKEASAGNSFLYFDIFKRLNQEGLTIVTATHDEKLGSQAKHVIRLVDGKIA